MLRKQLLQLGILVLKRFQLAGIGNFHAAKLGFVLVERCGADAVFTANFRSRRTSLLLLDHPNYLFVAEILHGSACLHARECVMVSSIRLLIRDEFYSKMEEGTGLRSPVKRPLEDRAKLFIIAELTRHGTNDAPQLSSLRTQTFFWPA